MRKPILHISQLLAWADAHRKRTGQWPRIDSGRVVESPDETWQNIDQALRAGLRGFPPDSGLSLARLLAEHRGVRNRKGLPPYTLKQILAWADAHRRRTGKWPPVTSGPIPEAPGETWAAVGTALRNGQRGMPGGSSLPELLSKHRRVRNRMALPRHTIKRILEWADAHRKRTGVWPTAYSGPVRGAPGETWNGIDIALKAGTRGLKGGSSLAKLLMKYRGMPRRHRWTNRSA